MSRRNYASIREKIAYAIARELERSDGHWPDLKKKLRSMLPTSEIKSLSDAMAAAVLASDLIQVTEVRKRIK